jgi:hypothetical protein
MLDTSPDFRRLERPIIARRRSFRGYAKVWLRGGIGLLGLLALEAFAAVSDPIWFARTVGIAAALIVCGFLAGEVAEGMRNREVWAFLVGIGLSVVAVIGSVTALSVFAPDLVDLNAVRWGSLLVFGGAGVAALVGHTVMHQGYGVEKERLESASGMSRYALGGISGRGIGLRLPIPYPP